MDTFEKKSEASVTELVDDERILARFGKRQQLRVMGPRSILLFIGTYILSQRGFAVISAVGLTCGTMLTWDTLLM